MERTTLLQSRESGNRSRDLRRLSRSALDEKRLPEETHERIVAAANAAPAG